MERGQARFEDVREGRRAIVVTEIPYQVNKSRMVERIAEVVREKLIDGISDLRDESDRDGLRVVIELRREAVPEVVSFGVDEVRALAEAGPSAWWADLVWVALGCGLRQEELLTLAWADVRIGKGSATVAVKVKDAPFRWQPKTAASLRIVVVCLSEAVAALVILGLRLQAGKS